MAVDTVEIVVEGPRGWTSGFLDGFLRGRGRNETLLVAESHGFDVEPMAERIREMLHRSRDVLHLLVPSAVDGDVRLAVAAATGAMPRYP